jgi:hypothetical protein
MHKDAAYCASREWVSQCVEEDGDNYTRKILYQKEIGLAREIREIS